MTDTDLEIYNHIRTGGAGAIELARGLFAVSGKEAVQFLDGMITNDMKTLGDGAQILAAFPNAQGRLLAVVRILRHGDRFLVETEEATREKVFNNLFRFTYAGDFFVEDLSENYRFMQVWNFDSSLPDSVLRYAGRGFTTWAIPHDEWASFNRTITDRPYVEILDEVYEALRIESGIPKYGIDMDENTIVPELGLDGMISYTKGCYIGQEIIARIHFRGHVAKRLTGLIFDQSVGKKAETPPVGSVPQPENELMAGDGKNAGRMTSITHSPKLEKPIALAFVRYDYLSAGTELAVGGSRAVVNDLPFL
jgi:tRNA-modifying protein YgfZ